MGNSLPKMSVRTRIALVPVVAAALCLLAVSANQDMDERAVIADLVKEAAGAYTTAASAAVTALAEAEKNQPSKEDKGKTLNIVEQPEEQLLTCMCERAGCMSDEDREVFDDAVTDATKKCKKTVALEIAEAMGDDESEEAEQPSREEMAEKVSECVCDSKKEAGHPCLNDEEWTARKEELKVIQAQCRKPLHDEL